MMKKLYQFILFRMLGWHFRGSMSADIKKCVIIVVPHTSWVDFIIGVLARGAIGLKMNFVAKKELFIFPFGAYFRWMGGTPLNRVKNENKVTTIAGIFKSKDVFRLAIAPEGTRRKVTAWKTGFYYIALQADVPVIAVAFDYGKKEIKIARPYYLTGNKDVDITNLENNYKGVEGFKKENSYVP